VLTPTEDTEEEKKVVFYDKLQQVNKEVQLHNMLCVTEDFNARFGNDREHHDKIMGKNWCGIINSNRHTPCHRCEVNIIWHLQMRNSIAAQRDLQDDLDTDPQMARHTPRQITLSLTPSGRTQFLTSRYKEEYMMATLTIKLHKAKFQNPAQHLRGCPRKNG